MWIVRWRVEDMQRQNQEMREACWQASSEATDYRIDNELLRREIEILKLKLATAREECVSLRDARELELAKAHVKEQGDEAVAALAGKFR